MMSHTCADMTLERAATAPSLAWRPRMPSAREPLCCVRCGAVGIAERVRAGRLRSSLVLLCCGVVPGIVHLVWRELAAYRRCASCGARHLITAAEAAQMTPRVPAVERPVPLPGLDVGLADRSETTPGVWEPRVTVPLGPDEQLERAD